MKRPALAIVGVVSLLLLGLVVRMDVMAAQDRMRRVPAEHHVLVVPEAIKPGSIVIANLPCGAQVRPMQGSWAEVDCGHWMHTFVNGDPHRWVFEVRRPATP